MNNLKKWAGTALMMGTTFAAYAGEEDFLVNFEGGVSTSVAFPFNDDMRAHPSVAVALPKGITDMKPQRKRAWINPGYQLGANGSYFFQKKMAIRGTLSYGRQSAFFQANKENKLGLLPGLKSKKQGFVRHNLSLCPALQWYPKGKEKKIFLLLGPNITWNFCSYQVQMTEKATGEAETIFTKSGKKLREGELDFNKIGIQAMVAAGYELNGFAPRFALYQDLRSWIGGVKGGKNMRGQKANPRLGLLTAVLSCDFDIKRLLEA